MARGRKRKGEEHAETSESKKESMKAKSDPEETPESLKEEEGPSSSSAKKGLHVNPKRVRELRGGTVKKGPVVYWQVPRKRLSGWSLHLHHDSWHLVGLVVRYCDYSRLLPFRMSRDQRHRDNWALLYACEVAARSDSNVVVVFNLVGAATAFLACDLP